MTSPMGSNRDVNVTVNAQVDPYVKGMNLANEATVKLTDGLKKLDDKIQTIVKRAGIGMGAAGGAGLLSMFGSAREAAQLEKSFESLAAATANSGESMKGMVDGAKSISREVPVATEALAGLMTQVKSLGVEGVNNVTKLTKVALELSAATNTPPGQLFTGLAELGRTMGTSIQNVERYGSSVTTLSQRLGVSADGVVNFSSQIEAVANKAGLAETQVLGLSAAFQRVGADGFAGATAFNTVINDVSDAIATNSSRLNTYANLLGMTREQFTELGKSNPAEVFVRFAEAVQASGDKSTQVLQQFGLDGVRTQKVFAALTSGQADMRTALGLSSTAYTENTSTATAAAAAWDGTADSFEKAKNAAHNLATEIGGPVADALKPMLDVVSSMINGANDLFSTLNDLPGPFHDLGSNALMAGSGLLMVGGALTALSWTAIKFLSVWRMVTGTFGINAFRGTADGLRGVSRDMEGVSAAGTRLYGVSNAAGSGVRGAVIGAVRGGAATEGPRTMGQRLGGAASAVIRFPFTRARQMGSEVFDTARHPFSPERRNMSATDPWSTYGMYQNGDRAVRNAATRLRESESPLLTRMNGVWSSTRTGVSAAMAGVQSRFNANVAGGVSGFGTAGSMSTPVAPTGADRETRAASGRFSTSLNALSRASTSTGSALASGARTMATGFASLSRGFLSFVTGPLGLLTLISMPMLIAGFQKLSESAQHTTDKLAYTGAEMAQRLGREFVTPQERKEAADKSATGDRDPFGVAETKDARSGDFQNAYKNTLDQITAAATPEAQLARVQQEVNRGVQQNNGAALDSAQQGEIRQLLIASLGLTGAQKMYGQLDLGGKASNDFYGSTVKSYLDPSNDTTSLRDSLASNAVTDYMDPQAGAGNLAYALAQTQTTDIAGNLTRATSNWIDPGTNPGGADDSYSQVGNQNTKDLIDQVVNTYNDQNPNAKLEGDFSVDDLGSFLKQLDAGNTTAQRFADNLRAAGLEVDKNGNLTAAALTTLQNAASGLGAVLLDTKADTLSTTPLNQRWQAATGDKSNVTDWLGNTQSEDYQQNLQVLLETAGQSNDAPIATLFDPRAGQVVKDRIAQLQQMRDIIGDPNSPMYQALDKLIGTAYSQQTFVGTINGSTPAEQLTVQAQSFKDLDVTNPFNATQYESMKSSLEQGMGGVVGTLQGYYNQIRDANRQMAYGEEDHNRQLDHMWRDRNIQLEESNYQFAESQRQANYSYAEQQRTAAYSYAESLRSMKNSYNEAFGNPAAFVSAQYTMGASSALIGMDRQVDYLKRSLEGLKDLRGEGVSNDVIKLLGLDKPENFAQVEKYLTDFANDPSLIAKFNATISDRLNIQEALASDPSNSDLTELDRTFQHSADEAQRAFEHAADESQISFAHSMETGSASFDRSLADFEESYSISVGRTRDEISRIGEDTMMSAQQLATWAAQSGVTGIENLGSALSGALDVLQTKVDEMFGSKRVKTSSGALKQMVQEAFGDTASAKDRIFGTADKQSLPAAQSVNPSQTSIGLGNLGTFGNSLGGLNTNGALADVANGTAKNTTATDDYRAAVKRANSAISDYKSVMADSTSTAKERKDAEDKATTAIKDATTAAGNKATADTQGKDPADQATARTNAQRTAFDDLTTKLGFVPGKLASLDTSLNTTGGKMDTTKTKSGDLKTAIDDIPKSPKIVFSADASPVDTALSGLKQSVSTAISWVINNVLNNGLIAAWNWLVDKLGLGGSLSVQPFSFDGGGGSKLSKGWATGGYTGDGGRFEPAGVVHKGEFVLTQEKTRKHLPLLEAIHRGDDAQIPGYASGGKVSASPLTWRQLDAIRGQLFPSSVLTSAYRAGANDYHGQGMAIDIGVPGNVVAQLIPIAQKLAQVYPQSTELINNPGGSIKNGKTVSPSFWGASTWNEHKNHVHWAMTPDALSQGQADGGIMDALLHPMDFLRNKVTQASAGLAAQPMGNLLGAIPGKMLDHIGDWIGDKLGGFLGGGNEPMKGIGRSTGAESIVQSIAASRGWGSGPQWDALYQLVQHESGFNPNAQNPGSTAYGLFQFLNSTWAGTGIGKTSDPAQQTQAGLNYIAGRYKTPAAAWSFWNSHNPHWYGGGGVFDSAQMIGVGERGPEAVIPLNGQGAEFVARTIQATIRQSGLTDLTEMRRQRTGTAYATPQQATTNYTHVDQSTSYSGDITVQASDPAEMQRKLDAQKRLAALTRPTARR